MKRRSRICVSTSVSYCWELLRHRSVLQSLARMCAESLPLVTRVELQPLAAQVERVLQALEATGSAVTADQLKEIRAALSESDEAAAVEKIQKLLDPMCLVGVQINPESRVTVQAGPAPKELIEQGWRVFLVKVSNQAGVTAPLRCSSPNAAPLHESKNDAEPPKTISSAMWCSAGWMSACIIVRH